MLVTVEDLIKNLDGNDIYLYVDYLDVRVTLVRCVRSRYYTLYINQVLVCTRVRFDNALRIAVRYLSTLLS